MVVKSSTYRSKDRTDHINICAMCNYDPEKCIWANGNKLTNAVQKCPDYIVKR